MATTVFRPMEINIPPEIFISAVMAFFIVLLIIKLFRENRKQDSPAPWEPGNDHPSDQADPETVEEIRKISSIDELMAFVSDYEWLDGDENKLLLSKALAFEAGLDQDDWASIYEIAAEGSELERVAEEKAGNALE